MSSEVLVAFLIVAACVVIHTAGILVFAEWLIDLRFTRRFLSGEPRKGHGGLLLIAVFAVLIFLHLIEAALWAGFYYYRGLFNEFETALYFSLTSYTTIGFGDVVLPQRWRLLAPVEGISGVLLCGISTAFVFAVMNTLFQTRLKRAAENRD